MTNERDTHFQGFAKLLSQRVQDFYMERAKALESGVIYSGTELNQAVECIYAQSAYDLLVHDRLNTGTSDLQHAASALEAEEMVNGIPDLKDWPNTSPEAP